MAQRSEVTAVYAAGVVQGLALVTFPAASTHLHQPAVLRPVQHGLRRPCFCRRPSRRLRPRCWARD